MLSSKTTNLACEVWAISWAPATIVTSVLENTHIVFLTTSRELRINKTTWPVVSGLLYLSAAVNSSIMFNCHSTNNEMVTNNYINNNNNFKQMKIIAVYTQLKQLRNKAWKKFRPERESNPWPLRYRCSALTNWAIKPTGSWSIVSSLYTRRWRRCDKNTWKSYICTAENTF